MTSPVQQILPIRPLAWGQGSSGGLVGNLQIIPRQQSSTWQVRGFVRFNSPSEVPATAFTPNFNVGSTFGTTGADVAILTSSFNAIIARGTSIAQVYGPNANVLSIPLPIPAGAAGDTVLIWFSYRAQIAAQTANIWNFITNSPATNLIGSTVTGAFLGGVNAIPVDAGTSAGQQISQPDGSIWEWDGTEWLQTSGAAV